MTDSRTVERTSSLPTTWWRRAAWAGALGLACAATGGVGPVGARADGPAGGAVTTTEGPRAAAVRVLEIGADGAVALEGADGRRQDYAAGELVRWGGWRERLDGVGAVLADASVLRIEDWRLDGPEVVLPESPTGIWAEARWPRHALRGLVLQWPASARERDRLVDALAAYAGVQDEAWLADGDRLAGALAVTRSPPVGDEPARERWAMRTRAGEVPLDRERVVALAFAAPRKGSAPADASDRGFWLGLRDGGCLFAKSLERRGERIDLELAGGATLACDAASLWEELRYVQPVSSRTRYLSDVRPVGYKHVPYLTQAWEWRRDRSVAGGFLRAAGVVHRKGLGMHSSSRLAFDLDEGARWFCAELAIDERTKGRGSAVCRAYLDAGEGEWKVAYESPPVRGGEAPIAVRIDVRDARRLALIVDFGEGGDELDHVDWLDARVIVAAP